jgi:glycosyltransferase involved in cell wall biosynthesis
VVQRLASIDGVNLVGEVPDVRPYLHAADIAISPLKLARGIQNKVLEAMACGLPVVTTTPSAEGIDAVDGRHLILADDEDQWHAALLALAGDGDQRERLGTAARDLVVHDYSWESKLQQVATLLATSP